MTLSEILDRLKAAGLQVTPRQVDYAIRVGHVDPVPYDPTGARDFRDEDIKALTIHFRTRRPRGRKPVTSLVGSIVDSLR